jgi:hypothetical protein
MAATESRVCCAGSRCPWLEIVAVILLAALVRVPHMDAPPQFDELYHILAARSWAQEGTFRILDGAYERTEPFTMLIGCLFRQFGESVALARTPSVISGALLVGLLFWWMRREAGRLAAWTSALLLCFCPSAIAVSRLARFYALQGLLVWIGLLAAYFALRGGVRRSRQVLLSILSVVALMDALSLQLMTVIPVLGLGVWMFGEALWQWRYSKDPARHFTAKRRMVLFSIATLLVAVAFVVHYPWVSKNLWQIPTWALSYRSDFGYYVRLLLREGGALGLLIPFAVLVALRRWRGATTFSLCVFAVGFVLTSAVAHKGVRFFYVAWPGFSAIWGMAVGTGVPWLVGIVQARLADTPSARLSRRVRPLCTMVTLAVIMLTGTLSMPARQVLRGWYSGVAHAQYDGRASLPVLRRVSREVEVVVSPDTLGAIYYLGKLDYILSRTQLHDYGDPKEFKIDCRVGRPIISTPESLATVMHRHRSGLLIASTFDSRVEWSIPHETLAFAAARMESVPLPVGSAYRAFRWGPHPDR